MPDPWPLLGNRILSAVGRDEYTHLQTQLNQVPLAKGQILSEACAPTRNAYFITDGVACTFTNMKNGGMIANQLIGREGFVGLPAVLGNGTMPSARTVMQTSGGAFSIKAGPFLDALKKHGRLDAILKRYALAQMNQLMQISACNHLHCIEERLAFWLLMTTDRVGVRFKVTHDMMAKMLGSRRATVTVHAEKMQHDGMINYRYGVIEILNRRLLEQLACECYEIQRNESEDFLK